jgi:L,D-transpeptidase catalytic domain
VIHPEQLAAALDRLDPRDRELLTLSLERRVPDESLARVYGIEPAEVARRRMIAIERLADELEAESGKELGALLEALARPGAVTEERRAPHLALALAGIGIAALIGAAALVSGVLGSGGDAEGTQGGGSSAFVPETAKRPRAPFPAESGRPAPPPERNQAAPAGERESAPLPAEAGRTRKAACYPTAYVRRAVTLYRRPGGPARVRLAARTEWKSPRVLGVVRRDGGWIAVQAPELRNGEIGWLPAAQAQLDCVRWSLHADISKRRLHVRWNGRTVRRYSVAVGSPAHPTPRGRFSVTDKLRVTDASSPYGCCVLALTGHQLRLPAGWPGGDRLAVHATNDLSSIGRPVSLGCMRTDSRRARWLIETIPQGTPIFIRS